MRPAGCRPAPLPCPGAPAGVSRVARSARARLRARLAAEAASATHLVRNTRSPDRSCALSRPPRMRIVVSNTLASYALHAPRLADVPRGAGGKASAGRRALVEAELVGHPRARARKLILQAEHPQRVQAVHGGGPQAAEGVRSDAALGLQLIVAHGKGLVGGPGRPRGRDNRGAAPAWGAHGRVRSSNSIGRVSHRVREAPCRPEQAGQRGRPRRQCSQGRPGAARHVPAAARRQPCMERVGSTLVHGRKGD